MHPSRCLAATATLPGSCTNVWGRKLTGGALALGFVNNGGSSTTVTCDAACFAQLGALAPKYTVRDLWAHADVGDITPPFTFSANVNGSGFAAAFKLTPA